MPYKPKSTRKFTRRTRKTSKGSTKVSKKLIRSIAKKVVSSQIQDKEVRQDGGLGLHSFPGSVAAAPPNVWTNANIFDTSVVYTGVAQGTGEGNRIGNIIRPKKFTFGMILTPQAGITTPIMVRMYVCTFKFDPNNAVAADIWGSVQNWSTTGGLNRSFFDNGNTSTGMAGDLSDLMKPINTDVWRVYKVKTFKVGCSSGPAFGTATGNNDFKVMHRKTINLLPYIPKRITYNDANTNSLNKKVFLIFQCIKADGTTNDNVSIYANLYYNYHFKYESA